MRLLLVLLVELILHVLGLILLLIVLTVTARNACTTGNPFWGAYYLELVLGGLGGSKEVVLVLLLPAFFVFFSLQRH